MSASRGRGPDGEVDFSDLGRLSSLVDRVLGHGRKVPLFLSEYTIPTHRNSEFPYWVDPKPAFDVFTAGHP